VHGGARVARHGQPAFAHHGEPMPRQPREPERLRARAAARSWPLTAEGVEALERIAAVGRSTGGGGP